MLYLAQKLSAAYKPRKDGADILVGWGKVKVAMTPAQARELIRQLAESLAQAAKPALGTSDFNRIVGANVRKEREGTGLTASGAASNANLSKSFISDLERGRRGVSAENLVAIARAIGATVEDLLRGT